MYIILIELSLGHSCVGPFASEEEAKKAIKDNFDLRIGKNKILPLESLSRYLAKYK